ncbi:PEP-CTERM sorting domain-containing protein [Isosphaeraceae bacterium EP7]
MALAIVGIATSQSSAGVLYETGFEPPTFTPGLFPGQDGWFAGLGPDAATISTALPKDGLQSVRIDGSELQEFSGFHFGSYARPLNYDPLASGTPIVVLSSDINLTGTESATCGLSVGLSAVLNGEFVANILFGVQGQNGTLVSYISNMDGFSINGPAYTFGEWANVTAVFDFANRTATGYFNGQLIGEVTFTAGIDEGIPAMNIALGSSAPIPGTIGYVDNFSLIAVPEPGTLLMLGIGILGLVGHTSLRGRGWRGRAA